MKLAACIGNSFDLETLSVIHNKDTEQVRRDLQTGLGEGLIIPTTDNYKFAHDRIQQAVYSLIPEEEKNQVHLNIGKLLWENTEEHLLQKRLFDIVNQWNKGREIITDQVELDILANLNLLAGTKAREASAFRPAYAYAVLGNVRELQEKVKPYEIRILAYKVQNKLIDAINTGLSVLGQLGVRFPRKATMGHVMADLVKTKIKLRGKNVDQLSNLPDMSNQEKIAAMRIIAGIWYYAYWATPALFPLLVLRMCNLSLKHGNTALSAFGFQPIASLCAAYWGR